ncbi:MAG: hypothetical protein HQL50_00820 [Magnetococcales bacterium]|nr:hypothetical protein [Magnetococcales bacterium]
MNDSDNPYLEQIHRTLPRMLALYDRDPFSTTLGQGDRKRWAWKLIDFGNGTFLGAAHGLARLLQHDLLPEWIAPTAALRRIEAIFQCAESLRDSNGSYVESFPHESSFCVTALVVYDLLSAVECLEGHIDSETRERWLETIRPAVGFLVRVDEYHGMISNHLATAAAGLVKWSDLSGESVDDRARFFVDRILKHGSEEGWFQEYEGADPGYQTLCLYYLADLHRLRPAWGLAEPLHRAIVFLSCFIHPDGSFGGIYGSRNTRLYYPAGPEFLAASGNRGAASMAAPMRDSIRRMATVTLEVMDEHNLPPMFNAYCWAAAIWAEEGAKECLSTDPVPAYLQSPFRRHFPEAGLLVDGSSRHYTVISLNKGGVCYHFSKDGKSTPVRIDGGVVLRDRKGTLFCSQGYRRNHRVVVEAEQVRVEVPLSPVKHRLPSPLEFTVLRLLNMTLMRNVTLGNWIKRFLVWLLITGKGTPPGTHVRTIHLGPDLAIDDETRPKTGHVLETVGSGKEFSAIHMASQGYWQRQDDCA